MQTLALILASLLMSACARPKYLVVNQNTASQSKQSQLECQLRFNKSGDCINLQWEQMQTDDESTGRFVFKIFRPNTFDGSPVVISDPQQTIKVVLTMPSMSHPPAPVTIETLDVGTYRASDVFFFMRGEWQIVVQRVVNENVVEHAALDYYY